MRIFERDYDVPLDVDIGECEMTGLDECVMFAMTQ